MAEELAPLQSLDIVLNQEGLKLGNESFSVSILDKNGNKIDRARLAISKFGRTVVKGIRLFPDADLAGLENKLKYLRIPIKREKIEKRVTVMHGS